MAADSPSAHDEYEATTDAHPELPGIEGRGAGRRSDRKGPERDHQRAQQYASGYEYSGPAPCSSKLYGVELPRRDFV